jgi:hypothetical protein
MGVRRAEKDRVSDAVKRQIIKICAVAGDEASIFPPARGIADDGSFNHCWDSLGFLIGKSRPVWAGPTGSIKTGRDPGSARTHVVRKQ